MSLWESIPVTELCQIKPPKKEAKEKLADADLVSFVPMSNLGICVKNLELNEDKPLSDVSGSYTYFADNDVLLAKITPCFENGKVGIANNLTNGIGFGSSEFIVFRSKGKLDSEYLFYFLSQDVFRDAGAKVMTGAVGHKRVPKEFIENLVIPLPPLPEQKRIVAILDEAFAGISKAVANAEKNLANARELFESYLNNVFTQKGDGWEKTALGDVCNFSQGIQVAMKLQIETKSHEGQVRFLRIVDFTQGNEMPRYIENPGEKYMVSDNDISLVRYGASTGFVCKGLRGAIANNLFRVVPKENSLANEYLYYFLRAPVFQGEIKKAMGGAAMPAISFGLVKGIEISIPSNSTQRYIVEKLDNLFGSVKHLETIYQHKVTVLAELKQSILKKAFTGEFTTGTESQQANG